MGIFWNLKVKVYRFLVTAMNCILGKEVMINARYWEDKLCRLWLESFKSRRVVTVTMY